MNCFTRTLLIALLLALSICAKAQYFPNLKKEISKQVSNFDSAILLYYLPGNGMPDEFNIVGYGVTNNKVYEIKLTYNVGGNFAEDKPVLKRTQKRIVHDKRTIDSLKILQFSSVFKLNEDSLNNYPCGGVNVSDASTDVLFSRVAKVYFNKQSYQPSLFQRYCPTEDRDVFIELRSKLGNIIERPFKYEIIEKTNDFDSIILICSSLNYNFNPHVQGYGLKGDSCFKLDIMVGLGRICADLVLKNINKTYVHDSTQKKLLKAIKFSSILDFNNDSLNKMAWEITIHPFHDTTNIIFYLIENHKYYSKQFHDSGFSLPNLTKDLLKFRELEGKLEEVLKK